MKQKYDNKVLPLATQKVFSPRNKCVMLKILKNLILEVDIYLFFKNGMRDGVGYISKRYTETNNTYLTSYNLKKSTKFITCLNKNILSDFATKDIFQRTKLVARSWEM